MKSFVFPCMLACLMLVACSNQPEPAKEIKQPYIPVAAYIIGEMRSLDSIPVGILKKNIGNSKNDSSFISVEEFKTLASSFLPPEIKDSASFQNKFAESSFFDQATEYMTFVYKPIDSTLSIKIVNVLISPTQTYDKISSIYMEKMYASGDTSIIQRMSWRTGNSFSIITTKSAANQTLVQQTKVIWAPSSY